MHFSVQVGFLRNSACMLDYLVFEIGAADGETTNWYFGIFHNTVTISAYMYTEMVVRVR